jgi:NADH dehydrogenase
VRCEELHVITGAYGYSSSHIATRLVTAGKRVRTITGHPDRPHPLKEQIETRALEFDNPLGLVEALQGATTLYNTYWVRFAHGRTTHALAVAHLKTLIQAAADAGVERVVHVSITNPSLDSHLPYFSGKAQVEEFLKASGLSYAILRPAVFFGGRDVLINNIAYLLRRLPVFGIPGKGEYGLQPIHVKDMANLAIEQGRSRENLTLDAVGPEVFSYRDLVHLIARQIGKRRPIIHLPRSLILAAAQVLGWFVHDTIITGDELDGLMANLLVSKESPTGTTRFSDWLNEHSDTLGREYANEMERHFR